MSGSKKFWSKTILRQKCFGSKEIWGLKKLAYTIENKNSGFYNLIEFTAEGNLISDFDVELRRDESIMRYLIVKLDKDALAWAEKRRNRTKTKTKEKSK